MPGPHGGVDAAPLPKHGHAGHPREPARRRRAPHHRLERRVARLPRSASCRSSRSAASTASGRLVRKRMGDAVLDRLVTPISAGVYSANPDDLDLDVVAPGLNEAMTRIGLALGRRRASSLDGAQGRRRRARPARRHAPARRRACSTQLRRFGVDARRGRPRSPGSSAMPAPTRMRAEHRVARRRRDARPTARPSSRRRPVRHPRRARADARAGCSPTPLDGWDASGDWPPAASVELVTLVLDAPALDAAPRGTGVLVAADTPGVHGEGAHPLDGEVAVARRGRRRPPRRAPLVRPRGRAEPARRAPRRRGRRASRSPTRRALLGVPLDERMLRASGRSDWRDAAVAGDHRPARPRARPRGRARRRARPRGDRLVDRRHGPRVGRPARDRGRPPHPPPRGHARRHRIAETEYFRRNPLAPTDAGSTLEEVAVVIHRGDGVHMKGKILFVVGLGVGYVLGTRAGRERYEQIKQAAEMRVELAVGAAGRRHRQGLRRRLASATSPTPCSTASSPSSATPCAAPAPPSTTSRARRARRSRTSRRAAARREVRRRHGSRRVDDVIDEAAARRRAQRSRHELGVEVRRRARRSAPRARAARSPRHPVPDPRR